MQVAAVAAERHELIVKHQIHRDLRQLFVVDRRFLVRRQKIDEGHPIPAGKLFCLDHLGRLVLEKIGKLDPRMRDVCLITVCIIGHMQFLFFASEWPGRDRLNDRKIDRKQDTNDHSGHQHEDQRFKKRSQLFKLYLGFCIVKSRDLVKHLAKAA